MLTETLAPLRALNLTWYGRSTKRINGTPNIEGTGVSLETGKGIMLLCLTYINPSAVAAEVESLLRLCNRFQSHGFGYLNVRGYGSNSVVVRWTKPQIVD
jgi:hypothetical protein